MDLTKAFDSIRHALFVANLHDISNIIVFE